MIGVLALGDSVRGARRFRAARTPGVDPMVLLGPLAIAASPQATGFFGR
jgi:hypothetical protein